MSESQSMSTSFLSAEVHRLSADVSRLTAENATLATENARLAAIVAEYESGARVGREMADPAEDGTLAEQEDLPAAASHSDDN